MKPISAILGFSLVVFSALAAPVAVAQGTSGLTAAQLEELFKKQKTRGLVIVPADPAGNDAGADDTTGDAATDQDAQGATVAVAPENYVPVDPSEQVNVQIAFDFDSAALREDQKPKLATLCQVMQTVDVNLFQIVGHTDSSGSASYNQNLSLLRAQEVKRYLVDDCGIDEHRLVAIGVGESAPFDPEHPEADVNRRVEFQALG